MTPAEALQDTLAGEHAAVAVYAILGGRVSTTEATSLSGRLRSAYNVHRARRDHLRERLTAAGEVPVAPAPGYQVDAQDRRASSLAKAARSVEERSAALYAQQVANSVDDDRGWALDALVDASVRGLGFGAAPATYPGVEEL